MDTTDRQFDATGDLFDDAMHWVPSDAPAWIGYDFAPATSISAEGTPYAGVVGVRGFGPYEMKASDDGREWRAIHPMPGHVYTHRRRINRARAFRRERGEAREYRYWIAKMF